MRFTAFALAILLALGVTTSAARRAHAEDIQVEDAGDEDLGDLGSRRPGQPRKPEEPAKLWGNEGFYGIVAGTYAAEDLKNAKNDIKDSLNGDRVEFTNSLGFNLRAGYRWHPRFATELEYEWIDKFNLRHTTADNGTQVGGIWSVTANSKAFLSTGRFEPFLLFGLGYYRVGDAKARGITAPIPDSGDFGMRAGAGLEFYVTDRLALNLEATYNFGESNVANLRYTSLSWGVMFRP